MTPEETGKLLAICASYDRRKVGDIDVIAWQQVLSDLSYHDCNAAVVAHYAEATDWIMPAHVRNRVKAMRRDRLAREIVPAPPAELTDDPRSYKAALAAGIRRIADGFSVHKAIGRLPSETPPPIAEVRKQLGPALPRPERLLSHQEMARRQVIESRMQRGAPLHVEPGTGEDPAA
jgi:hypothetical protein